MSGLPKHPDWLEDALEQLPEGGTQQQLYDAYVSIFCKLSGFNRGAIYLLRKRNKLQLVSQLSWEAPDKRGWMTTNFGYLGKRSTMIEPFSTTNAAVEDDFDPKRDPNGSLAIWPILHGRRPIGFLVVADEPNNTVSEDSLHKLSVFTRYAGFQICAVTEIADLRARNIELKARSDRYELIHQIGKTLVSGLTLQDAMQKVVDIVATQLNYTQTAVLLYDPQLEELEVISEYGYGEVVGLRIPTTQGATGYAVCHREPVNIADVTTDPRYLKGIRAGRSELVVPIVRDNEVWGVIDVESPHLGAFDQEDVALLNVVAAYASAAIEAARCEEDLREERDRRRRAQLEVQLVSSVANQLRDFQDPLTVLDDILDIIPEILSWQTCALWLIDPSTGQLVLQDKRNKTGIEIGTRIPIGEDAPGRTARLDEPILMDTYDDDSQNPSAILHSEIAAPLRDRGEMIGVLHVERASESFNRGDLSLITTLADQISVAISSTRLRTDTKRQLQALDDRTRRLDLLHRVIGSLTRRLELDELLDELLRLCAEAFSLSNCAVLLLDEKEKQLIRSASIGYLGEAPVRIPAGVGITGHVLATGVPILVSDVTQDPRYIKGVSGGRSEMAVPLRVFGEIIGVLDAESSQERAFVEDDLDLFSSFAAQAAVAIHNANLISQLEERND